MKKKTQMNTKMRKEKQKKSKTMQSWERMETWPPTTAMAGKASQRVGKALSSPWSPRAVQALCILFTNEIRFSIQTNYSEIQRNEAFLGFSVFFEFCWGRKEWQSLAKEPLSERVGTCHTSELFQVFVSFEVSYLLKINKKIY